MEDTKNYAVNVNPEKNDPFVPPVTDEDQLNSWLLERYDAKTKVLNLDPSKHNGDTACFDDCYGKHKTPSEDYKKYVAQFMANPDVFLNKHPEIEALNLRNNYGNWDAKVGLTALANNNTLRGLDLTNNSLDDEAVISIANNKKLETLLVGHNHLHNDGLKALAENQNVTHLDISMNTVSDQGISFFANNKILTALYAEANLIGPEGAKSIANIATLKTLDISDNSIGHKAGVALATQLKNLTNVNLKHTDISSKTVRELLKNDNLTEAHVSWNEVGIMNKFRLWHFTKHNQKHGNHENKKENTAENNKNSAAKSSVTFFQPKPQTPPSQSSIENNNAPTVARRNSIG